MEDEKLKAMTREKRNQIRKNAEGKLRKTPDDQQAKEMLQKLDELDVLSKPAARRGKGEIDWRLGRDGKRTEGYYKGEHVLRIVVKDTHRPSERNSDIYDLEIRGLPVRYEGELEKIEDTRKAAEEMFFRSHE